MKYIKNLINNIMYLLKHDIKLVIKVNRQTNKINELEKALNHDYGKLANQCINNKIKMNELEKTCVPRKVFLSDINGVNKKIESIMILISSLQIDTQRNRMDIKSLKCDNVKLLKAIDCDMVDIKDDIKSIKKDIINNKTQESLNEYAILTENDNDLLINECIKVIISRLENYDDNGMIRNDNV